MTHYVTLETGESESLDREGSLTRNRENENLPR